MKPDDIAREGIPAGWNSRKVRHYTEQKVRHYTRSGNRNFIKNPSPVAELGAGFGGVGSPELRNRYLARLGTTGAVLMEGRVSDQRERTPHKASTDFAVAGNANLIKNR